MQYAYITVDVFSPVPFGGNQLAVLTDSRGITSEGMQAITREFNYAETCFVLPPADSRCDRQVRIFTPGGELPFAGHPTVGTACVLVATGACPEGTVTLEEGIGAVPVAVGRRDGVLTGTLTLERGPDLSNDDFTADEIASVLGISENEVADVFCAGMGVNFTFIQLKGRDTIDAARLNQSEWQRVFADSWGAQLFIFAGELADGNELYARMFAPGLGIMEDPATGGAVAALVGAAALRTGSDVRLTVAQGVGMGRPSFLEGAAELVSGEVRKVQVGGACVLVAEGRIDVPANYLER